MPEQLTVQPLADYPKPIAEALWRLQDARQRTMKALADLPDAVLDWQGAGLQNSIGTLLYHIAAAVVATVTAPVDTTIGISTIISCSVTGAISNVVIAACIGVTFQNNCSIERIFYIQTVA